MYTVSVVLIPFSSNKSNTRFLVVGGVKIHIDLSQLSMLIFVRFSVRNGGISVNDVAILFR